MKFKVHLQLTVIVERDLEHYDLEEDETLNTEDKKLEALKEQLEDELTGEGYSNFIFNESDIEDDDHKITYLSE